MGLDELAQMNKDALKKARDLYPDLEKMLNDLATPGAKMNLLASLTVAIASKFRIVTEDLVEVVRGVAADLVQMGEEHGVFKGEEAAAAIRPHIWVQSMGVPLR